MVLEETATIKHALLRSNNFYEIYGGEDACCNIGGRLVIGSTRWWVILHEVRGKWELVFSPSPPLFLVGIVW